MTNSPQKQSCLERFARSTPRCRRQWCRPRWEDTLHTRRCRSRENKTNTYYWKQGRQIKTKSKCLVTAANKETTPETNWVWPHLPVDVPVDVENVEEHLGVGKEGRHSQRWKTLNSNFAFRCQLTLLRLFLTCTLIMRKLAPSSKAMSNMSILRRGQQDQKDRNVQTD